MLTPIRCSPARGAGVVACVVALTLLSGCGGSDGGTEPETPRPTTLTVTPAGVTLTYIGGTTTLVANILDQNGRSLTGTVTWASDAATVATVSSTGLVTAVGNGSTTVRATAGALSTDVAVTVQQVVSSLTVASGNDQSAIAGEPLAQAVVVRAQDLGGAAVAGVTVTFTPDQGGGTVSVTSAVTDSGGMASTVWTMGSAFGPQRLTASVSAGASAIVTAHSKSPVPLPDLVTGGTLILARTDPTTLDTVTAQVTVRNDGDASTGQAFRVRLLSDGQEVASQEVGAMAPGASQTLVLAAGTLDAGAHTLRLEVDADGSVEELVESNNVVSRSLTVVLQTLLQPGTTLSGLSGAQNVELLYRLDLPVATSNITVELSGGTGDPDVFVTRNGVRPPLRKDYSGCQSGSPTTKERCQVLPAPAGSYHILVHASSTFSGTTMRITLDGEVLPFNIEVVFVDHGTPAQDAVFTQAAQRWMSIITTDLTDSDFSIKPYPAGDCLPGQPAVSDEVDDVRIYVSIDSIDGPSKVLARASACVLRGLSDLPLLGYMEFDEDDIADLDSAGEFLPVVLHEMAHVLGLGTLWGERGLLKHPSLSDSAGVDTHFTGAGAIEAFDAAGGTSYTGGSKVPVENTADEGSADSHWRETVLRLELMTPFFSSGQQNPLSAITIRSMADLGYHVDVTQADPYSGSFSAPARAPGISRPIFDLRGDVARRPIVYVDQKGRVVARR